MDFNERCYAEERAILTRLNVRYSRAPEKRQEHWTADAPRMPMDIADELQRRRNDYLMFEEFSESWNDREGAKP